MMKRLFLPFLFLFSLFSPFFHPLIQKEESTIAYTITPNPQSIVYQEGEFHFPKRMNIVASSQIDEATKEEAIDLLSTKPLLSRFVAGNEGNNLILLTKDEANPTSVNDDLSYLDNKIDAYYLAVRPQNITIIGKDSDAVFYGLKTLRYLFLQSEDSIRCLTIKDYAQTKYRGFIEGYYGIPWTTEERKDLMRFGSQVKTNLYLYAPKDDVYHSTDWRSLYTKDDLSVLQDVVKCGIRSKTKLAWAIHPFMNQPLTRASFASDLPKIEEKFEQVYEVGVRQFVVSADDIPLTDPSDSSKTNISYHALLHRDCLNRLARWCKAKGDCASLLFVPTTYHESCEYSCEEYFSQLISDLDPSIDIMWTGEKVCSSMSHMAYSDFSSYTGGKKPFLWMNWPVNDYAINYLLLGKAEVLDEKYSDDLDVPFSGLVLNPMPLAEASKISIFSGADYAWNTQKFDCDRSYASSLETLEKKESEPLTRIAEHLTNGGLFEDRYFAESESVKPLISAFKSAVKQGSSQKESQALIDYFSSLIQDCDLYLSNASNQKLLKNIAPWVKALKATSFVLTQYLYLYENKGKMTKESLHAQYDLLTSRIKEMKEQTSPNLIAGAYEIEPRPAKVSKSVLEPFLEYLNDLVIDDVELELGIPTGIKTKGLEKIYEGDLSAIHDGDEETYCWFGEAMKEGSYIRIEFDETIPIQDVRIVAGNSSPTSYDYFAGEVELSLDAKTWTSIGQASDQAINEFDLRSNPIQARFLRLLATSATPSHWVSLKEIEWNVIPKEEPYLTAEGMGSPYKGSLRNIVDNNPNTYCWFGSNVKENGYLLLDYHETKTITSVSLRFGTVNDSEGGANDRFEGVLQSSIDGANWVQIGSLEGLEVVFDRRDNPFKARYLRLFAPKEGSGWVAIREITLNSIPADQKSYSFQTITLKEGSISSLNDGDSSTFAHFDKGSGENASITLDCRSVKTLKTIRFFQGCDAYPEDYFSSYSISISLDGVTFKKIGADAYVNQKDLELDCSSLNEKARYIKIASNEKLSYWVAIREFSIDEVLL